MNDRFLPHFKCVVLGLMLSACQVAGLPRNGLSK
jgi:hypothetical protein